jgi:hypothetical protein
VRREVRSPAGFRVRREVTFQGRLGVVFGGEGVVFGGEGVRGVRRCGGRKGLLLLQG